MLINANYANKSEQIYFHVNIKSDYFLFVMSILLQFVESIIQQVNILRYVDK